MIRRGFTEVDGLHVHWRAAGSGPVVVMLHESPRSSTSLLPLLDLLSQHFCCIAFDTPGYGASDPLPDGKDSLKDFAVVLRDAINALGLEDFGLYGTHTGAAIALELAELLPERVTALLLDGLAMFSAEEQQSFFRHYLICHKPRWDGSHLMQIWSRILDQTTFFPFYSRSPNTRLAQPNTDLNFILRTCIGFLESGNHYQVGYRAAIAFDPKPVLLSIDLPCRIHAREHDLLASHLKRAGRLSACVTLCADPLPQDDWLKATKEWLSEYPASTDSAARLPQHHNRKFIDTSAGPVFVVRGPGKGLRIRGLDAIARPAGLYGIEDYNADAGWLADAPACGVNASASYDPTQLARLLGAEVMNERVTTTNPTLPPADALGGFLTSAWFAAREALILRGDYASGSNEVDKESETSALVSGHLALLYSHLNRVPRII